MVFFTNVVVKNFPRDFVLHIGTAVFGQILFEIPQRRLVCKQTNQLCVNHGIIDFEPTHTYLPNSTCVFAGRSAALVSSNSPLQRANFTRRADFTKRIQRATSQHKTQN